MRPQTDRITLSLALQCETHRNRTGTQCAAPWVGSVAVDFEKSHLDSGREGDDDVYHRHTEHADMHLDLISVLFQCDAN